MTALNIRHKPPVQALLARQTSHVRGQRKARLNQLKGQKVVDAFLVFDKNHPRSSVMHYITDAAEDIVYDVAARRTITITMLRPTQLGKFYEASGVSAPRMLLNEAKLNAVFDRNI